MTLISYILLAICHVHAHSLGLVVQSFGGGEESPRALDEWQISAADAHITSNIQRTAFSFFLLISDFIKQLRRVFFSLLKSSSCTSKIVGKTRLV